MSEADPRRHRSPAPLPLPQTVALVLQAGGALGSFQAGLIAITILDGKTGASDLIRTTP